MIALQPLLQSLAARRPVFHSEADFQHELAWEIRLHHPEVEVRLERPLEEGIGATDLVLMDGPNPFGIELKFCTRATGLDWRNEAFQLKQHGAHPLRRYDICKDIERMERFNARHQNGAAVIVLTNDPAYWGDSGKEDVCDKAYRITQGRRLEGSLAWGNSASAGTRRNRESAINLSGSFPLNWNPYSKLEGRGGLFQYLLVNIE